MAASEQRKSASGIVIQQQDRTGDRNIGGDWDDALTVLLAALTVPQLRAVITADELGGGQRARLARWLLDLCGRPDVVVAADKELGTEAGKPPLWAAHGLVPDDVAPQTMTVLSEIVQALPPDARARSKFAADHTSISTWDNHPAPWAPQGHRWELIRHNDAHHLPPAQQQSRRRPGQKVGS